MIRCVEIDECESSVLDQLRHIQRTTKADWSVEQVLEMCRSRTLMMFADEFGWVLIAWWRNRYTRKLTLEVFAAWYSGGEGLSSRYPFLLELARQTKSDVIEVHSPRRGWERRGFSPVDTIYRMEVPNDLDV